MRGVVTSMRGSISSSIGRRLARAAMTAAHRLMKLGWFVRRPRTFGAHALALTPDRLIILVRLRYAPGWRLPGGGRRPDEDPREAVLRELREEIGMIAYGAVRVGVDLEERADFKRDLASLLIVEEVIYRPRNWSWEVERICEAHLDDLPPDLSPRAAGWIAAVRDKI